MKKIRFVFVAIVVALLLGSFVIVPGAQKSIAGTTSKQSIKIAALPALSPFLFAASAPVITAMGVEAPAGYACSLTAQTPADWKTFRKRTSFNVYWTLKNTGSKVWGIHGVDVVYRGGTTMHTSRSLYDLPRQTSPGQKITLAADMIAPKQPGYYVSNWGLNLGFNQTFCKFYIVIYVSG